MLQADTYLYTGLQRLQHRLPQHHAGESRANQKLSWPQPLQCRSSRWEGKERRVDVSQMRTESTMQAGSDTASDKTHTLTPPQFAHQAYLAQNGGHGRHADI